MDFCSSCANPNVITLPPSKCRLESKPFVPDIEGVRGKEGYVDDDALGHGSHVAGSAAGAISSDWEGPAECPQGVDGAAPEQTAQSCVGSCMKPYTLSLMPENAFFDLDAFCPEVMGEIIVSLSLTCMHRTLWHHALWRTSNSFVD